jgi:hypothetical protein
VVRPRVASGDPKVWPVLLRPDDRRLPIARQILEAAGVKQRLLELAALLRAHLAQRRVADDLLDAAAQAGARQ